jgi:glycerate kinase
MNARDADPGAAVPLVVVIAPDSFKGSATAADAARALATGWTRVRPFDRVILKPMADGGEGTADAFATAFPEATAVPITVRGPDDRPVSTTWLHLPADSSGSAPTAGGTAVIELASTSGITLLDPLLPLHAHTYGFGEAIAAALAAGASRLVLAIGGSASTDGGSGMLAALGARFTDADGRPLVLGGGGLADLATIDISTLIPLPPGGVVVLTDVTNPLLGPSGAAAVYGPQKGADADTVSELDHNLAHFSACASEAFAPRGPVPNPEASGAGAAGGTGYGLALWGATLQAGATTVSELVNLTEALDHADLVITGEGRYDAQSAQGKVPTTVRDLAAKSRTQSYLVAGSITADSGAFAATRSLTDLAGSSESSRTNALHWLETAGAELASDTVHRDVTTWRTSFTAQS